MASELSLPNELPPVIREVLEQFGYGCLAAESRRGIVHICHAPDRDIAGFAGKPVRSRWQLIKMPTAPLIRLELVVLDNLLDPFRFESFLNVGEADQLQVLTQLAGQEELADGLLRRRPALPLEHNAAPHPTAVAASGRDDPPRAGPTGSSYRRSGAITIGRRRRSAPFLTSAAPYPPSAGYALPISMNQSVPLPKRERLSLPPL